MNSREAFEQFAIKEFGITARGESPGWRIWQAALEWQAARESEGGEFSDSIRKYRGYAPQPDKWIPCSERLPDADAAVLVFAPEVDDYEIDYLDVCADTGDEWFANDPGGHITHWMPMPTPPEQESE